MAQPEAERGALLAGDVRVLEMIASGSGLRDVLNELVLVIEQQSNGMRGSVLLLEGSRVRHGAAPNLPADYMAAIDGQEIGPSRGSCGTAAYLGQPVIAEDIATDVRWTEFKDVALRAGLQACWSVPIMGPDRDVLGTFALYYSQPRRPAGKDLALIHHASSLAAIAIERHRAEEALRASEARARLIIENALDANVIVNGAGVVTSWSPRAEQTFGWSSTEAVGQKLFDLFIPPRDRAAYENTIRDYLRDGEARLLRKLLEITAVRRGGEEFPAELFVTPIQAPGGVLFSAFIRDITERKRAEEALRESEQHRTLVYNHVADVLFDIGVEPGGTYRFVSVNPAFERSTGIPAEAVLGRLVSEVIPEPSRSLVLSRYEEAIRTRTTVRWDETTVFPTGTRMGDVSVTPVFDASGRPRFLIGSVRDVTEQRQLADEVRQLQKMEAIARLSGGVAHDFNNILCVILMTGNLLLQDITDEALREQVQEIVSAAERGAALTRQVLAFSRKQIMRPETVDLNAVVANLEKMLRRLIGENIALRTGFAPDLWRVSADPGQVEQVVMNLVVNARDAMPGGGTITIETSNVVLDETAGDRHLELRPGPYAMLTVTDTGCGMDADTRRRIFEPFFTTKEPGKGTGLGLATVYGIVKQSGGDIRVQSEVNQGTTFRIYLPRTTAAVGPAQSRAPRRSSGHLSLGNVLVVEDEAALRASFTKLLPQIKCRATVVGSAEEALAAVQAQGLRPDLVITDVTLPGMSGKAMVDRLREQQPELKVLYISGYPDDAIAHHGVLNPGTPFLQKPFTVADLSAAVEDILVP